MARDSSRLERRGRRVHAGEMGGDVWRERGSCYGRSDESQEAAQEGGGEQESRKWKEDF